jgi:hypothetical protein
MASILPFTRDKSDFDDEATRLMGEAFDAACKGLRDTGQPDRRRPNDPRLNRFPVVSQSG